jgi:hypothetical protein
MEDNRLWLNDLERGHDRRLGRRLWRGGEAQTLPPGALIEIWIPHPNIPIVSTQPSGVPCSCG